MISKEEFLRIYHALGGEPEFSFLFAGTDPEYMVIKYADHATFQRCGREDGSGEVRFTTIEELLAADAVDGICLERDWARIRDVVVDSHWRLDCASDREELLLGNELASASKPFD